MSIVTRLEDGIEGGVWVRESFRDVGWEDDSGITAASHHLLIKLRPLVSRHLFQSVVLHEREIVCETGEKYFSDDEYSLLYKTGETQSLLHLDQSPEEEEGSRSTSINKCLFRQE